MSDHVVLNDPRSGNSCQLPIIRGTQGPDVIDIRTLYARTGMFAFDPGFTSTASCDSGITYIDGNQGILSHRGYSIQELASQSTYLEVCFLLLNGQLPSQHEYEIFVQQVTRHTMVHEQLNHFFRGFRRDAHPMAILTASVAALAAFYPNDSHAGDGSESEANRVAIYRLICKLPTLAAMTYKYTIGQPFVHPRNDLSYVGNFLHMCFAVPAEEFCVRPSIERAMEQIFILHADHEQNASTSTVRLAGSTGAPPFACISAGISALWGAAHGGANEAVLKMLREIKTKDNIPHYIQRAKDSNDSFRLMGFGHRVYKNHDPRAEVLRQSCHDVLKDLGKEGDPLLSLAMELEKISLEDEYFKERRLYPNVDFYSGILLEAIGFPTEMFTVLFAISRVAGWVAQWKEMTEDKASRIGRPRQRFVGPLPRSYVPLSQRAK